MGIFFISIDTMATIMQFELKEVSVPFGDLFYFYNLKLDYDEFLDVVSVPFGDLFYFYETTTEMNPFTNEAFPSPLGIFFISMLADGKAKVKVLSRFPSPLGIFFISILSYGNLNGHRENLPFAAQKVFSGKIGGFEACKLL